MSTASSHEAASHASARDREIVDAKVIVTCPGRNFVTLKIVTRSGVTGLGDATLNGRELAVASYLQDHVVPNLIGRDAGRIEDIWQFFYRGSYWRRGPVTMTAIAAVDVALWDILGKFANLPIYQLLGGRSREGALVYGHANGRDISETSEEVGRFREMGFLAIRAQCGVPGVKKAYGISAGGKPYEPAESELPAETVWSTPRYLDIVPQLFERLRADHGPEVELLHDVHHRLTPIEAARLARSLEPYRLFWLEDATPAENQKSFELIRQHSDRLHPHHHRARRRHHAPAPPRGFRRPASGAHRLSRRDRPVAGVHGRGAAFRYLGAQLRHPGIHVPLGRGERGVPARLCIPRRSPALRRHAGAWRDHRRKARRPLPLRAQAAAHRAPGRRLDVGLVTP